MSYIRICLRCDGKETCIKVPSEASLEATFRKYCKVNADYHYMVGDGDDLLPWSMMASDIKSVIIMPLNIFRMLKV